MSTGGDELKILISNFLLPFRLATCTVGDRSVNLMKILVCEHSPGHSHCQVINSTVIKQVFLSQRCLLLEV